MRRQSMGGSGESKRGPNPAHVYNNWFLMSAEEAAIRHRASVVAVPSEWIGFFEFLIACRMLNITILVVFGSFVCDVNVVFGAGLPVYFSVGT